MKYSARSFIWFLLCCKEKLSDELKWTTLMQLLIKIRVLLFMNTIYGNKLIDESFTFCQGEKEIITGFI
jgi:hypothetical protein